MKHNEAVKQYLTSLGWIYKGGCNCGGIPTHKYRLSTLDGDINIKIRQTHYLVETPNTKYTKHPISGLKQAIDEISKNYKTGIQTQAKI